MPFCVLHCPSRWHSSDALHAPLPAVHVLWTQMSSMVHGSPSLQSVPFRAVCVQPLAGLQPSCVHGLVSPQLTAPPPVQVPATHVSFCVHAFPSLHAVPAVAGAWAHAWVFTSQESTVHGLPSLQSFPTVAWHCPLVQALADEQSLPSSQVVPLVTFACAQPLAGLHESVVQTLLSSQETAAPAWQVPALQVSPCVQALPSLQGVLAGALACWQP